MIERWAGRLLEGKYFWGDLRVGAANRAGWTQYRLTLYPPGTNGAERRRLQFWYSWPLVGALMALVSFVVLGDLVRPLALVALTTIGYVAGIVVGWMRTRQLRPGVRTLAVAQFPHAGSIRTLGDLQTLSRVVHELTTLDAGRRAGTLTAAQYELGWWTAYDQVAPRDVRPFERRHHRQGFNM